MFSVISEVFVCGVNNNNASRHAGTVDQADSQCARHNFPKVGMPDCT
jgi:hypothetical protein